jgi:cytidylate kinase
MDKIRGLIITIDGPAGAGKSTVSKELAKRLSYRYLDTGAIYRAVAYKMKNDGIAIDNEKSMADLLSRLKIELKHTEYQMKIYIDGMDITEQIRTEEIGLSASKISANPLVRKVLLEIQRAVGKTGSLVAEGRDMGTVVFPNADVKFFLDADPQERIKRRYKELLDKRIEVDVQAIEKDMHLRDQQDRERQVSPLKIPEKAIVIDSSNMTVIDVIEVMMNFINKYNKLKS